MSQTKAQLLGPVLGDVNYDSGTLFVDSVNNRVGIGTTNPQERAHIYGTGYSALIVQSVPDEFLVQNSSISLTTEFDGSYRLQTGTEVSGGFRIYDGVAGQERLRITSTGNIGLGTTNPTTNLDLYGNNANLIVRDSTATSAFGDVRIAFGNSTAYPTSFISHAWDGTNGQLSFHTRLGGDENRRGVLDSLGNFSIGQSIPSNHAGFGKFSVFYTTPSGIGNASQPIFGSNDGSTKTYQLSHTGASYSYAGVGGNELWHFSTSYNGMTFGSDGDSYIKFVANGSERVRIKSDGNVGIGTTNPLEKLDVRGNIYLTDPGYIHKSFTDNTESLILRGYGGSGWVPWISYTPSFSSANRGYKIGAFANDATSATWYYLWNGAIGIGTTPQKTLHINSPRGVLTDSGVLRLENEDRKWDLNIKSGKLVLGDDTASADRVTVDTNGNVGIGTTNPSEKLSVFGTGQNITANESGTSNSWRSLILSKNSAANRSAFLGVYGTVAGVFAHTHAMSAWAPLYVNTVDGVANSGNVIMGGSVGIGAGTPSYKLHVVGTSSLIQRDLYIAGNIGGSYANRLVVGNTDTSFTLQDTNLRPTIQVHGQYPVISLNHTVTTNTGHGPTLQFTCNGTGNQFVIGTTGNGTRLDIGTSAATDWNPHNGISAYNGITHMSFTTSGNVGVGQTNPNCKFHVTNGNIQAGEGFIRMVKGYKSGGNNSAFDMIYIDGIGREDLTELILKHGHEGGGTHGAYRRFVFTSNAYSQIIGLEDTGNIGYGGGLGFSISFASYGTLKIAWNGGSAYPLDHHFCCWIRSRGNVGVGNYSMDWVYS